MATHLAKQTMIKTHDSESRGQEAAVHDKQVIKTYDSELRGQEEAAVHHKQVSYLHVAPL